MEQTKQQKIKSNLKYAAQIGAIFLGLAAVVEIPTGIRDHLDRDCKIEKELAACSNSLTTAKLERDNYRRELIEHGNPEGWKLNGDGMFSCWYERVNGDGIGAYWNETLEYK